MCTRVHRANEDYAYDGYARDASWKNPEGSYAKHGNAYEAKENVEWIEIDPHILCTPVSRFE